MCANYLPSRQERLAEFFGVEPADYAFTAEAYPGGMAPILRLPFDDYGSDQIECVPACFGMVPHWADMKLARQTYNARSETVASKPSFRHAWAKRQFCLIPADAFFEPNYESGHAVRWKIADESEQPVAMAGIWEWRAHGPDDNPLISFSMLTINADEHPVMRRFHKPGDEKRMPIILLPEQYQAWLHADLKDAPKFFNQYPAQQLHVEAAPRPKAAPRQQLDLH